MLRKTLPLAFIGVAFLTGCATPGSSEGYERPEIPFAPYQADELDERPVYTPPEPERIWVAPSADDSGNLVGSYSLFFVRAGGWAFGQHTGANGANRTRMTPNLPGDRIHIPGSELPENPIQEWGGNVTQPRERLTPKQIQEGNFNFPSRGD